MPATIPSRAGKACDKVKGKGDSMAISFMAVVAGELTAGSMIAIQAGMSSTSWLKLVLPSTLVDELCAKGSDLGEVLLPQKTHGLACLASKNHCLAMWTVQ